MDQETDTGDGVFDRFSASEEEQEKDQEGAEGEDSLALLAAMMDGGKEESDTNQPTEGGHRAKDVDDDLTSMCSAEVPSASGSRVSPRAGKRKIRGEDRSGGVAKRKRLRKDEEDGGGTGAESAATPGQDSMAEMKAEMRKMQEEILRLKKKVSEGDQRPVHHAAPPPPAPPASAGGGKRRRQAHQPNPQVTASISRLSESAHGLRTTSTSGYPSGPSGSGCGLPGERGVAAAVIKRRREDEESNCLTEKYSGLRIKNPVVSSEQMHQRMQGRKMVRIPRLASRARGGDIEGDWVTIGVVVDKLPPRDTAKGEKFSVWKLSDLSGQSAVVSLFLFGRVYQEHWKTAQGTVVALLNPSIMPEKEGGSTSSGSQGSHRSSPALTLDHPQKLMLMGVSQDFTTCKAHTKSGKRCTNFAKASDGGYCDYHVQGAYRNTRAQRMEFQSGYGPNASSGKLREKLFRGSGTEVFYYAGQSFTSAAPSSKGSTRVSPSEGRGRLFAPGAKETATTMSQELQERREANAATRVQSGRGVVTQEGSQIFKQMLSTQSVGARMLSKHFQKEETVKKTVERSPEKSASELLKDHKQQLKKAKQPSKRRSPPPASSHCTDLDSDLLFSPDCVLSVDGRIESVKSSKLKTKKKPLPGDPENESDDEIERKADSAEGTAIAFSEKQSQGQVCARSRRVTGDTDRSGAKGCNGTSKSGSLSGLSSGRHQTEREPSSGKVKPLCSNDENRLSGSSKKTMPPSEDSYISQQRSSKPDSGLQHSSSGSTVRRNESSKPLSAKAGHFSLRRQPSLRMLEQQGSAGHAHLSPPQLGRGFKPGGVVDLSSSSKPSLAKLKALAVIHRDGPLEPQDPNRGGGQGSLTPAQREAVRRRVEENCERSSDSEGDCEDSEGAVSIKKRRLDSSEVQRILNAKSSHDWVVKEDEWEREQEYFDRLEKKENIEEKLKSITELRVAVIQCKQCNYVAEHPGELCRRENHHLSRFKATKKWFECQDCRERCCTYNARYPSNACRKCGSKSFKLTSFHKDRQGPKLPTEQLLVRGVEEKFLNSLN